MPKNACNPRPSGGGGSPSNISSHACLADMQLLLPGGPVSTLSRRPRNRLPYTPSQACSCCSARSQPSPVQPTASHARLDDVEGVVEGGADAGRNKAGRRRLRGREHLAVALLQQGNRGNTISMGSDRLHPHLRHGFQGGQKMLHGNTHVPHTLQAAKEQTAMAPSALLPFISTHVLVEEDAVAQRLAPEQAHLVAAAGGKGAGGQAMSG